MTLAEKLRHLRQVEGTQRGLGRAMTKAEVARLMPAELGAGRGLSAAYLSQLESGARSHMTEQSRARLAAFFKVHPGYLVSDPDGFETELLSGAGAAGTPREDGAAGSRLDDPLVANILWKLRRLRGRAALEALDRLLDLPDEQLQALARSAGVETAP